MQRLLPHQRNPSLRTPHSSPCSLSEHILCVHLRSSNCAHSRQKTTTNNKQQEQEQWLLLLLFILILIPIPIEQPQPHLQAHRRRLLHLHLRFALCCHPTDFLCVPIFSLLIKINNLMIITFKVFNLQTFRRYSRFFTASPSPSPSPSLLSLSLSLLK